MKTQQPLSELDSLLRRVSKRSAEFLLNLKGVPESRLKGGDFL